MSKKISLFVVVLLSSLLLTACFNEKSIEDYTAEEILSMSESELRILVEKMTDDEKERAREKIMNKMLKDREQMLEENYNLNN